MASVNRPTRASSSTIGYFSLMLIGIAFLVLGLAMHTGASMMSGTMLGLYFTFYCPVVWVHITSYRSQVYRSEWLFMFITLSPIPVWLATMFFAHVSDEHTEILILPTVTLFLAYLLPSEQHPVERVPAWQRSQVD